jgi:hypothetical protein
VQVLLCWGFAGGGEAGVGSDPSPLAAMRCSRLGRAGACRIHEGSAALASARASRCCLEAGAGGGAGGWLGCKVGAGGGGGGGSAGGEVARAGGGSEGGAAGRQDTSAGLTLGVGVGGVALS